MRFTVLACVATIALVSTFPAFAVEFYDNFEDGDLNGWECDTCEPWFVSCANPNGAAFVLLPDIQQTYSGLCVSALQWSECAIDVDLKGFLGINKMVTLRSGADRVGYNVNLRSDPFNDVVLDKIAAPNGPVVRLAITPLPNTNGTWLHLRIEAHGPRIQVSIDGIPYIDYVDPDPLLAGGVCLRGYTGSGGSHLVQWDNVFITEGAIPVEPVTWGQIKASGKQ